MENDFLKYENEIYFFINLSQKFFHAYQEHLEYYEDSNPLFSILLGSFGSVIVDDWDSFNSSEKIKIFNFIERALNSSDEYLSTVIATGLLEALVTTAENKKDNHGIIIDIVNSCKQSTLEYIKEWSNFQAITLL